MTITSEGQVTLPISIRRQLHLEPGDLLDASVEGDKLLLRKAESGQRWIQAIEATSLKNGFRARMKALS